MRIERVYLMMIGTLVLGIMMAIYVYKENECRRLRKDVRDYKEIVEELTPIDDSLVRGQALKDSLMVNDMVLRMECGNMMRRYFDNLYKHNFDRHSKSIKDNKLLIFTVEQYVFQHLVSPRYRQSVDMMMQIYIEDQDPALIKFIHSRDPKHPWFTKEALESTRVLVAEPTTKH